MPGSESSCSAVATLSCTGPAGAEPPAPSTGTPCAAATAAGSRAGTTSCPPSATGAARFTPAGSALFARPPARASEAAAQGTKGEGCGAGEEASAVAAWGSTRCSSLAMASPLDLRDGNLAKNAYNGENPGVNAPRSLDSAGRSAWRSAVAVLREIAEDPELSASALLAYAHAESVAASLREQWRVDPRAVLTGGRGAKAANPILRELERAEKLAAELREALGLTPAGRRRIGRAVQGGRPAGAASARDRAQPPRRRGKVVPITMPREVRAALGDAD
jgi:P27 family predicted phage terminase small subunit